MINIIVAEEELFPGTGHMIQIGYDENDEDAVEWNFGDIDFKHPEGWDPFNDKDGVFPKSLKEKIISFQDSDQITADYLGKHRTEEAEKWFDELQKRYPGEPRAAVMFRFSVAFMNYPRPFTKK